MAGSVDLCRRAGQDSGAGFYEARPRLAMGWTVKKALIGVVDEASRPGIPGRFARGANGQRPRGVDRMCTMEDALSACRPALFGPLVWAVGCGPASGELDCERGWKADPDGPPPIELVQVDPDRSEMAWGHLLMNQSDGERSWATVVNGCAQHIWWRPPEDPDNRVYRAHLSRDRSRVLMAEHPRDQWPDTSVVHEIDIADDALVRSTRTLEAHHDFRELPGEQLAWLSHEYLENAWFPNLDGGVVTDAIRVADLGETEEVHEAHFSLYHDTGFEPWWTCNHMKPNNNVPGYAEWSHSNSLVYDESTDRLYLHARHWDTLLAVEADGSLAWALGGPHNEFDPVGRTQLPKHAHLSEAWDGGLLALDNRNHDPDHPSRVVELAWDEDRRTVEEVWSWSDGTSIGFLGDAKRLPGGNVLVVWSPKGRMVEVTPRGDVVWEAVAERGLSRVDFHAEWPPR